MTSKLTSKIKSQPYSYLFSCLFIVILSVVIYGQTLDFGLIDYDDDLYLGVNPHLQEGFTYTNFIWSISYFLNYNWAPLVIWSYIADASLYGGWYGGYHLTNLILHAINGLLLYFIALKLSNRQALSLLLAVLFIVHPQHVESVAWLSQRKDVLSALFMFLSVSLYISCKIKKVRHYYLLSIGAFMLGLMAKVIIAPLPVVLMLIDYVFLSSSDEERNLKYFTTITLDKVPYFIMALIFGGINYYAQLSTGALSDTASMPTEIWVSSIPLAYWFYPIKTLMPINLIPFYPYPEAAPWLLSLVAMLALVMVTVWLYLYRNKYRYLFFGWFCYLIISTPMNGIFQTGSHAYADRYSYLANIGLLIMVIVLLVELSRVIPRKAITAFVVAVAVTLSYLSYAQTVLWKDTYMLFSHTLEVDRNNLVAQLKISNEFVKRNKFGEAEKRYLQIIESHPHLAVSYISASKFYQIQNKSEYARSMLDTALKEDARPIGYIYKELASLSMRQKEYKDAIDYATKAIDTDGKISGFYLARGTAKRLNNNYKEAISDIKMAIAINRQNTAAYTEMGNILLVIGNEQEALHFYLEALKQMPSYEPLKKRVFQLVNKYNSTPL